jgi:propionyl-CoA carboxylase alpha chain
VLDHGESSVTVRYRTLRDGSFRFGDGTLARIHSWSEDGIDVEIGGRRTQALVTRSGDQLIVQGPNGDLPFTERPRFKLPGGEDDAGGFVAPMPGKVVDVRVKVGDRVGAGDTVMLLEAMKMEHPMQATEDGVVSEVRVTEGEQVEGGALLLVIEPAKEA